MSKTPKGERPSVQQPGTRLGKEFNAVHASPPPSRFNPIHQKNSFSESLGESVGLNSVDRSRYDVLLQPEDKGTKHGFDAVLREKSTGKVIVVEQKGQNGKVSPAQKDPKTWVESVNAKTIARQGQYAKSTDREIAVSKQVAEAMKNGHVEHQVHRTSVNSQGHVRTVMESQTRISSPAPPAVGGPVRSSRMAPTLSAADGTRRVPPVPTKVDPNAMPKLVPGRVGEDVGKGRGGDKQPQKAAPSLVPETPGKTLIVPDSTRDPSLVPPARKTGSGDKQQEKTVPKEASTPQDTKDTPTSATSAATPARRGATKPAAPKRSVAKPAAPKPAAPKPSAPRPAAPAVPRPAGPAFKPAMPRPAAPRPSAPKPAAPRPVAPAVPRPAGPAFKPATPRPAAPRPSAPKPALPRPVAPAVPRPAGPALKPAGPGPAVARPQSSPSKPSHTPSRPAPTAKAAAPRLSPEERARVQANLAKLQGKSDGPAPAKSAKVAKSASRASQPSPGSGSGSKAGSAGKTSGSASRGGPSAGASATTRSGPSTVSGPSKGK